MSIAVSTGQRPVLAGSAGWLMAIVTALAIALAGVVALNQSKPGGEAAPAAGSVAAPGEFRLGPGNLTPPGVVNPADSLSSYDAAIVAAAEARAQGEAKQALDAAIVAAAEARAQGEAKQAYDAAIVAAAEARAQGEAKQALELRTRQAQRATPQ